MRPSSTQIGHTLAVAMLFASIAGCTGTTRMSREVSDTAWQRSVESYLDQRANGDPSFLRTYAVSTDRSGYAIVSDTRTDRSTDMIGVLLGQRVVNGSPWVFFLRATIDQQQITDMRIVAMSRTGGQTTWRVSDEQPAARRTYLANHPTPSTETPYRTWPAPHERFKLEIEDGAAVVTDARSGARWTLRL